MSTARKYEPHYTVSDYELWKGDWELWHGTAVAMTPSPFGRHQLVVANLSGEIRNWLKRQKSKCRVLTEIDWQIADDLVVRPDLVIVCHGIPERYLDYTPHLVVEVVSKSTEKKDRTAKYDLYEQQGVETYVIVDPNTKNVDAFQLEGKSYQKLHHSDDELAVSLHGQQMIVACNEIYQ